MLGLPLCLWAAGCANVQTPSLAMPAADGQRGLNLRSDLPTQDMPDHAVPVPHAQFVLLPAESSLGAAVDMLMPIPFVLDAVKGQMNASEAAGLTPKIAALDPLGLLRQALQAPDMPALRAEGLDTHVFALAQECVDDRYRFALVAQLHTAGWNGRYLVHLPLTLELRAFQRGETGAMVQLNQGLAEAASQLAALLQRATRGQLQPSGVRVDVGSLHLVGSKANGLLLPTLMTAKDSELVEEDPRQVLVRIAGNPSLPVGAGGLLFGVHLLPRDQLHTYVRRN